MSHDCIVGRTRAGSWWTACTHPGCDHYQSGAPSRAAAEERGAQHYNERRKRHGMESPRRIRAV